MAEDAHRMNSVTLLTGTAHAQSAHVLVLPESERRSARSVAWRSRSVSIGFPSRRARACRNGSEWDVGFPRW